MVLPAPHPPPNIMWARYRLLVVEQEKRQQAFDIFEKAELDRHKATRASLDEQTQRERAVCMDSVNGQLTEPIEYLLKNRRDMLFAKEDEEYERGRVERKKAFDEKEKEYTKLLREHLLMPLPPAQPVSKPSVEPPMEPSVEPSVELSVEPSVELSVEPSVEPSVESSVEKKRPMPEAGRDLGESGNLTTTSGSPEIPASGSTTTTPASRAIAVDPPSPRNPAVSTKETAKPKLLVTLNLPKQIAQGNPHSQTTALPSAVRSTAEPIKPHLAEAAPKPHKEPPKVLVTRKRARSDERPGGDESAPLPCRQKTAQRTITFNEVYCNGEPKYKHIIAEFPLKSSCFYILRCDEHVVHFGRNPLHGAAKHLHSAQHGCMTKEHSLAVELLGHRVLDCTPELADKNNEMVRAALDNNYKPLNINQMGKSDRRAYELEHGVALEVGTESTSSASTGFPNPKKPVKGNGKKLKPTAGIESPVAGDLYLAFWALDQKKYPVIVLPCQGTLEPCGLPHRSLLETALVTQVPSCYVSDPLTNQIVGWAPGFEDGGPRVRKRKFPVMFFDAGKGRNFGWVRPGDLSSFNFDDPDQHKIPHFNDAIEHFARVRGFGSFEKMTAVANGRDLRTVWAAPRQKFFSAANAQHSGPQPPPYPQATPVVPSSGPVPARNRHDAGALGDAQRAEGLGSATTKATLVDRRGGGEPQAGLPSTVMTKGKPEKDDDVEMANTSEKPSTSVPTRTCFNSAPYKKDNNIEMANTPDPKLPLNGLSGTLADHLPTPDRRDGDKPDSPSVTVTTQDNDVEMADTSDGPSTTVPIRTGPPERRNDKEEALPLAPTQTGDQPQTTAKNDNRSPGLAFYAAQALGQSTEPRSTSTGPRDTSLHPHLGPGLPSKPVVSEPGGRIQLPLPPSPAPYAGPVVPSQSAMLATDRPAPASDKAAMEPQYITSRIPPMKPWVAGDQEKSALQPLPSIEIPLVLSPVVTPDGSAAATPTTSTAPSRPMSRTGSVPSVDTPRERTGRQGEIFDVSLLSDASRTVHRLTVDLDTGIASAPAGSLTIDPRTFKEAVVEVLETNRSSRMVRLVSNDGRAETLVFEAADVGSGQAAGSVHARRFGRWLKGVNRSMNHVNNSYRSTPSAS